MTTTRTSGWRVSHSPDYFIGGATVVRGGPSGHRGVIVAVVTKTPHEHNNSQLITAAPELYAACLAALEGPAPGLQRQLRAALAKAQGVTGPVSCPEDPEGRLQALCAATLRRHGYSSLAKDLEDAAAAHRKRMGS